jgi:methylmalonyl-CoA/ethylmalonyl-CoA epimerase
MSFFDCGGVRLMVGTAEKPEFDHPASIIYYTVADIRKTHEMMTSRGVQFESNPHLVARMPDYELWMAFFRDLDNNMLALMSEIKK